ncbi:ADP-heptose-LPS heptosyltransferase II [Candidatus Photodesmus katoptron]|uniref:ADP-heptose:LPS heptosyltransferase n=2 Tax=Candidatus Photodesmus anomalopis TaxID=28176 RepID=S3DGC8_9GAMM|nr:ADP-heptose:LPS heptosyltransferase [Candidatus Photodesmus katoptron Akat1]KEY90321.1 ADP-heptose-LPS heptosyltransferase II [Candidatus Photodesmus katoptron]
MLKMTLPDWKIIALVPNYTIELAELCPWIDKILLEPTQNKILTTLNLIKEEKIDYSINFFSNIYNAMLVWKSGIPYRLAPATKISQIFYNKRLKQRRSQSIKPEFQYNLDLAHAFLQDINQPIVEPNAPYLTFSHNQLKRQKNKLVNQLNISKDKPWIFLHIGTGGSANNLSLEQYAQLIDGLYQGREIILTAGPKEEEQAKYLKTLVLDNSNISILYNKYNGLIDFSMSIACSDLFISGSTGPLHIAGAIDIPTVGFFPSKRSSTPLRWKPINTKGNHIAFYPPYREKNKSNNEDMSNINIFKVLEKLKVWIFQHNLNGF